MTLAVWSVIHPDTLFLAIAAGVLAGAVAIARVTSNPFYGSGVASAERYGLVVGAVSVFATGVFWSGQILQAWLSADPSLTRLVARFVLNILYCVGLGAGTALGHRLYSRWKQR